MTEQVFDILTSITKKCYSMHSPRSFFDELMSPFIFLPLLQFSADGGAHTRQGARFLRIFFHNLFVAEPHEAELDQVDIEYSFASPLVTDAFEEDLQKLITDDSSMKSIKEKSSERKNKLKSR